MSVLVFTIGLVKFVVEETSHTFTLWDSSCLPFGSADLKCFSVTGEQTHLAATHSCDAGNSRAGHVTGVRPITAVVITEASDKTDVTDALRKLHNNVIENVCH